MLATLATSLVFAAQTQLTLHVDARPSRSSSGSCIFLIHNPLIEGGRETTCLTHVEGFPAPDGLIRSRGQITFALPRGAIRVKAVIVMRFAADGVHAKQTLTGTIIGGTRAYSGMRGSVSGAGDVVDRASELGPVRLTYRLVLRRVR